MKAKLLTIAALFVASLPLAVLAMQSGSYKIKSDTINIGGVTSESNTYIIDDTLGEIATGDSASSNFAMHAGFWQMQEVYIGITTPDDVALPPMTGLGGGSSSGSAAWTVTTDNEAGYSLTIKASTDPALKSSNDNFADYAPAVVGTPDYTFSIAATDSEFGFSPEGNDILAKYKDDGADCNTGLADAADACWDGLSTTETTISQGASSNHPSGTQTTVKFQAASGASHMQTNGTYTAALTVTAVSL